MATSPTEEAQLIAQAGSVVPPVAPSGVATQPFAQTFDRRLATGTVAAPATGVLNLTSIWLPAGKIVTGITFVSGSTAQSGGTHLWYALYRSDLVFLAQSADNTAAAAMAANTALRQTLTTAQTLPYSGMYYLGFMCTNSAGAQPTLTCVVAATVNSNGNIAGMLPIVAATSTGSLTTTAPNPAGALTTIAQTFYAFVD